MTRHARTGAAAALTVMALCVSGCDLIPGDSETTATSAATTAPTLPTPSPLLSTPTPVPTQIPTQVPARQVPTSNFEDRDHVVVARTWATLAARSINDGETNLGAAKALMTTHGRDVLPGLFTAEFGRFYPGPIPFTPTVVSVQGSRAAIAICLVSAGFSRVSCTTTTDARRVVSARLTFIRPGGEWKVDELQARPGSCDNVTVEDLADPTFIDGGTPTATPAPSAPAPSASSAPSAAPTTGINPPGFS